MGVVVIAATCRIAPLVAVLFLCTAPLALTGCGGGGAASPAPSDSGSLALSPASATLYAGVPYDLNIVGGRKPYLITSSEPTIIALNRTVSASSVTIVANNPGVVDPSASASEVPRRSVTISVRDSLGATVSAQYSVLQNFFTGYRQVYSNTCPTADANSVVDACSGTDSLVQLVPVSQGSLYVNRELRLDRVRGDFTFVNEASSASPQTSDRIQVRTDGTGRALARIRVALAAPAQLATYTITDVATGATTTVAFVIVQVSTTAAVDLEVRATPASVTLNGLTTAQCGSGTADFLISGGRPPYSIGGVPSGLTVAPGVTLPASGSRLTVTVPPVAAPCPQPYTMLVSDSVGRLTSVTVNTSPGIASGAQALELIPEQVTLPGRLVDQCGNGSTDLVVVGGRPPYAVSVPPGVGVAPAGPLVSSGSRLTVTIPPATAPCPPPYSILVTDSSGNRDVTSIVTTVGSAPAPTEPPEIIPPSPITFKGGAPGICGGGSADVFVVGGLPPYRISAPNGVSIAPASLLLSSGSRLTVSIASSFAPCPLNPFTVLVTDSLGLANSISITSLVGDPQSETPVPPIQVVPSQLPGTAPALKCGQSASVALIGALSPQLISARSTHPRVSAAIEGLTLNVRRLTGDGATSYPDAFSVSVTDGISTGTLSGTTATLCP